MAPPPANASWLAVGARAFAVAAAGATFGLVVTAISHHGLPAIAPPSSTCQAPQVEPKLISATEAAHLCAGERTLIVDARPAAEYAEGHVAEAVHLSCDSDEHAAANAIARLGGRSTLLVYGSSTEQAVAVARSVARRAPTELTIYALEGGFAAWARAGLACASGPCENCTTSGGP